MADLIVVSGFGRCGSSLMMQMLDAGGLDPVADNTASYEDQRTLRLPSHPGWLDDAGGRPVKVLDPHIHRLPANESRWPRREHGYRVIWLDRDPKEQSRSMAKLLLLEGRILTRTQRRRIERGLRRDRPKALRALPLPRLGLRFRDLIQHPENTSARVRDFLGEDLDVAAMVVQVIPRDPGCLEGFLELSHPRLGRAT